MATTVPGGASRPDRLFTIAGLAALCVLTWAYLLSGAGMVMQPAPWSPGTRLLVLAMWWSMMVAMMVPGAMPAILLYARVRQHAEGQGHTGPASSTVVFAAGYFLAWLVFSVVATMAQEWLQRTGAMSTMAMRTQLRWLSGAVLVAAGAYQLSPLKSTCLSHCRAPAAFLSRHWRPGAAGALRLGVMHGAYCVGCCWMLMAVLFVTGIMHLAWIAVLTLLVLAEKVLPGGPWLGRAAGAALVAWGVAVWLQGPAMVG